MQSKFGFALLLCVSMVSCVGLRRPDLDLSRENRVKSEAETKKEDSSVSRDTDKAVRPPESLGVILGPGYLKAYSHLGVLKQIDQRSIPIKAIAGVEWGAIVAAAYAKSGRASEPEWQLFKLEKENLAGSALFTGKIASLKPEALDSFFTELYRDQSIESSSLAFACPSFSLKNSKTRILTDGKLKEAAKLCIGGDSFYSSYRGNVWDPFSVSSLVDFLKRKGATKILFVNVISESDFNGNKLSLNSDQESFLWAKANYYFAEEAKKADYFIQIDSSAWAMNEESKRREFLRAGEQQSQSVLNRISKDILGR